ncbi:MAG: hypothetical protein QW812_03580, partial [Thermoplasmataceae archaeon]
HSPFKTELEHHWTNKNLTYFACQLSNLDLATVRLSHESNSKINVNQPMSYSSLTLNLLAAKQKDDSTAQKYQKIR